MLKRLLTLVVAALFATNVLSLENPGITASAHTRLIENHKTFLANFIIDKLNTVQIPNITIPSGNLTVAMWNCTYEIDHATIDQIDLLMNETANSVYFVISPLMAKFKSNNFTIHDGILRTSGELIGDIYDSQIIVGIELSTTPRTTPADGKLLPNILPWGVRLTIDRRHLDIRVDDSLFGAYIELITDLFKQ